MAMLKNLLKIRKLKHGGMFVIDGKHKMTWNGFPIIVMGSIDADQHFMPVAYAVVSRKRRDV